VLRQIHDDASTNKAQNRTFEPRFHSFIAMSSVVEALVSRARAAQAIADRWTQAQADEAALAVGWAIVEPSRNRALTQLAVRDKGIGNVADKIAKNRRKTVGLLRDLKGAKSVGILSEDPERGLIEIVRPVGIVAANTPPYESFGDACEQHHQCAQRPQCDRARAIAEGPVDPRAAARIRACRVSTAFVRRAISFGSCRHRSRARTRSS